MKRLLSAIASLGLFSTLISPFAAQSTMIPQADLAEGLDSYYDERAIAYSNKEVNESDRRGIYGWWRSLLQGERRDGGRDDPFFADFYFSDQLCAVSPNGASVGSWSPNPLFIWRDQGNSIQRVEVYSENKRKPVWSVEVGTGTEDGWYVLDPTNLNPSLDLEVGVTYYFALRKSGEEGIPSGTERIQFEILPEEDRVAVATELEAAGVTGEAPDWRAFQVFMEQSSYEDGEGTRPYFLDVTRILFSMPRSPERDSYIDEIVNTYC